MKKYLLPKEGRFFKANLHMHTTVSDGKFTPEETKDFYKKRGYSVVAFSDHEVMVPHPELTDENFLALTATETEVSGPDPKTYHLNVFSPEQVRYDFPVFDKRLVWGNAKKYLNTQADRPAPQRYYDIKCVNKLIAKCNEAGFLVSYNHPVWSVQNASDYADMQGIWGVECFNTGCYIDGFEDTMAPVDLLLSKGQKVFVLATDDAHKEADCCGGRIDVKCNNLNYEEFFGALKKGYFYASTGPEINELYIENGTLYLNCSPVKEVFLSTGIRFAKYLSKEDGSLENASFDIKPLLMKKDPNNYFRITLVDKNGKRAWSNPYFIKDI